MSCDSNDQWEWAQRRWPDGAILWAGESEANLRASMEVIPFRTLVRRLLPDGEWEEVSGER